MVHGERNADTSRNRLVGRSDMSTLDPAAVALVAPVALPRGENKAGVELAEILDQLDALLGRYVAFPSSEARWAVAAWIVHTHALEAFESTPRLALLSPEKGSGKTRTLEVLELVVPSPLFTVNVSAAALFRKVSEGKVTLLLDEADTYLGNKVAVAREELRGLVNAGHRRGAVAYRCVVEKGVRVDEFPAFAPAAIAGIGDLPDTILDRSVVIPMKRRAPGELVVPFRHRRAEQETWELRDWLASWAEQSTEALGEYEPVMPAGIVDRPADVWEALIVIGDHAGARWSERLRAAAVRLNDARQGRDPSLGVQLLADCRSAFAGDERVTTDALLDRLHEMDESPWGDLRGKPLDARGLAWRLRKYEVRPGDHRFEIGTRKGYLREDFHDAWNRYLTPLSLSGNGQQGQQAQPTEFEDLGAWCSDTEVIE